MKVLPFNIPKQLHENLIFQLDEGPHFYGKLHQHEEIQISYIRSGYGKIFVSESIGSYGPGDIIAIGANTPHIFQTQIIDGESSVMYSLFFTHDSFGKGFFNLSEMEEISSFFVKVEMGLKLSTKHHHLDQLFLSLPQDGKLQRFLTLIHLLQHFCKNDVEMLSEFRYKKNISNTEGSKMRAVFEHVFRNFHDEIKLQDVADLCYMTPNAFCRYFKQRTNKTFFQFVIELRMEHACQLLLQENDFSVSEIAFLSGFKSITHFNRKFKLLKGVTPGGFVKN